MKKLSPLFIKADDIMYRVEEFSRKPKFELGYAYYDSNISKYVFPFRGKIKKIEDATEVGVYILNTGKSKKIWTKSPRDKADRFTYSIDRIRELTPDVIYDEFIDDIEDVGDIGMGDGDIFTPPLCPDDDLNLIVLKSILQMKQIDLNKYTPRFRSLSDKNNEKRRILTTHTLSMNKFCKMAKIFDIDFAIIFKDNDKSLHPMDTMGRPFIAYNGKEFDIDTDNLNNIGDIIEGYNFKMEDEE